MSFLVQLTDDATGDLEEICDYIDRHDVPGRADYVLEQIEKAFSSLSEYPERGNYPRELLDIGIREYREIFFKPYRIIYRVMENNTARAVLDSHTVRGPDFESGRWMRLPLIHVRHFAGTSRLGPLARQYLAVLHTWVTRVVLVHEKPPHRLQYGLRGVPLLCPGALFARGDSEMVFEVVLTVPVVSLASPVQNKARATFLLVSRDHHGSFRGRTPEEPS